MLSSSRSERQSRRVHPDPQVAHRQRPEQRRREQRGREPGRRPARPGDHRPDRESRRPVAGDQTRRWSSAIGTAHSRKRLQGALAVEPRRGDEAGDRPAGDDLRPASGRARCGSALRLGPGRGTRLRRRSASGARIRSAGPAWLHAVAVVIAVEEDLEARVGPDRAAGARSANRRTIGASPQWFGTTSIAIRLPDVGRQQVEQPIDLALEARRHVVDRGQQKAVGDRRMCAASWPTAARAIH